MKVFDRDKVKNQRTGRIEYKRKEQNYTQISLATGSGKSTHFPRCLAFRGLDKSEFAANPSLEKGVTLVVPNDELAENLRKSHTE
ncbi:10504_t:CDS:2 [Paraglomus occultum]|uniref:10504_t:CDS:1 n=1 Tax=Paraglomus occultum TaxID=144539 RepID=A0A9N9DAQ2_9GLOM|nr:10504_t:CDS:2 [Paraglomus occultum]